MRGPTDEFREQIAREIDALESEEDLYEILDRIEGQVREDEPGDVGNEEDALHELGAIEAWASLASDATIALYAPGSLNLLRRKGRDLAGWSNDAVERLRRIAQALRNKLGTVAAVLGALVFSIGVNFPWGITIGISWSLAP
jgi:uncharacterized membrane protein YccC